MSDSDDEYGPPLPPGFPAEKKTDTSSDEESFGPALPVKEEKGPTQGSTSKAVIGPALPPHLTKTDTRTADSDGSDHEDRTGPALPPHLMKTDTRTADSDGSDHEDRSIGPALPPHLMKTDTRTADGDESDHEDRSIGPALPPHLVKKNLLTSDGGTVQQAHSSAVYGPIMPGMQRDEDEGDADDDETVVGPTVSMRATAQDTSALEDIESRAQKMRDKLTGKDNQTDQPIQRETWMTELPPEMGANFGLTNRSFRKNAAPTGDRSEWTDTPADRERKEKEGHKRKHEKDKEYIPTEKDIKTAKEIEAYNKAKRPESLLEMHQKKRKKNKKKEKEKPKERRPFDRDLDLQVNKLDEAQRKAIIKRSQQLGSRFQSGGTGTSFL